MYIDLLPLLGSVLYDNCKMRDYFLSARDHLAAIADAQPLRIHSMTPSPKANAQTCWLSHH